MAIIDLNIPRNDIDEALRVARKLIKDKKWRDEYGQVLSMLQDDPDELEEKLIELMEEMGIDTSRQSQGMI